jgi:hypothetical protein
VSWEVAKWTLTTGQCGLHNLTKWSWQIAKVNLAKDPNNNLANWIREKGQAQIQQNSQEQTVFHNPEPK